MVTPHRPAPEEGAGVVSLAPVSGTQKGRIVNLMKITGRRPYG